jgi:hypothetical protein
MVSLAIIVIVAAFFIAFFVNRRLRKRRRRNRNQPSSVLEVSELNLITPSSSEKKKKNLETKRPIDAAGFVRGVRERGFPAKNEYDQLKAVDDRINTLTFSSSVARKNGTMNR